MVFKVFFYLVLFGCMSDDMNCAQWEPRQDRPILGFENPRLCQRGQLSGVLLLVTITIPVYLHHFVTITITLMLTTIPTRRLNLGTQGDLQSPRVVSILQVFLHLLFF